MINFILKKYRKSDHNNKDIFQILNKKENYKNMVDGFFMGGGMIKNIV